MYKQLMFWDIALEIMMLAIPEAKDWRNEDI